LKNYYHYCSITAHHVPIPAVLPCTMHMLPVTAVIPHYSTKKSPLLQCQ